MLKVTDFNKQRTIGIVVDSVADTHNVDPQLIKHSPEIGGGVNTKYIKGLVSFDKEMMMILNIDLLLSVEALASSDVE
jgi:purine-binding chemotaxis protein CheW